MTAKDQVRKLCEKRFGRMFQMRENPKALDAAAKAIRLEQRKTALAERKAAEVERNRLLPASKLLDRLAVAAQFVVDVKGDDPSIGTLAEALKESQQWLAADERYRDACEAYKRLDTGWHGSRCEVCRLDSMPGLGAIAVHEAAGDTWTEVLAKMKGTEAATATTKSA